MKVRLSLQNVPVLFLILTVQQLSIGVSSQPEGLERLVIETRNFDTDFFTLYFKNGFRCTKNGGDAVSKWCGSLNADYHSDSNGRRICSCTCKYPFRTFLPQKQLCLDSIGAEKFGGKLKILLLKFLNCT